MPRKAGNGAARAKVKRGAGNTSTTVSLRRWSPRPAYRAGDTRAGLDHLMENRSMIVRRSLLATAVGGVVPLPVLDEYFAGRVKAACS